MKNLNYLFLLLIMCFASCSVEHESIPEKMPPIIRLLQDFKQSHNMPLTRSGDFSQFNITHIKTNTYSFDIRDRIHESPEGEIKRAKTIKDSGLLTVELSTVEFEKEGDKGFAILTDDERISRVYAYKESGQLSDTSYNIGLRAAIHDIKIACEQDLISYYNGDSKIQAASNRLIVQPITGLEWCQCSPYNNLAGYCHGIRWDYVGRAPAGCTAVAIAQVVA